MCNAGGGGPFRSWSWDQRGNRDASDRVALGALSPTTACRSYKNTTKTEPGYIKTQPPAKPIPRARSRWRIGRGEEGADCGS